MQQMLNDLKLDYEIINAVAGEELLDSVSGHALQEIPIQNPMWIRDKDTNYYYYPHGLIKGLPNIHGPFLNKYQIACTLSHFKIYNEIKATELQCALILEDDVFLNVDKEMLITRLKTAEEHCEKYDLAILENTHSGNAAYKRGKSEIFDGFSMLDNRENDVLISGTGAYVVTRNFINLIDIENLAVSYVIDNFFTWWLKHNLVNKRRALIIVSNPQIFKGHNVFGSNLANEESIEYWKKLRKKDDKKNKIKHVLNRVVDKLFGDP